MKKDRFQKIPIKKIKDEFTITCPVCGYSFRPRMDPKNQQNKLTRCPMCGYKWNRPCITDENQKFSYKKF